MSFDYAVVVRGRKRKAAKIRELAAQLLPTHEAHFVELDDADDASADDDEDLDISVGFAQGGGTIEIRRLLRGYKLSLDSQRDGNRDSWEAVGGLLDDLAAALGTVVDDKVATEMIVETDDVPEAPRPALASLAEISLEDRDGAVLRDGRVALGGLQRLIQQGGMLLESNPPLHPMLSEDGRYGLGARVLVAVLHDSDGTAFRRYRWTLDGYGRITGIDIDEL